MSINSIDIERDRVSLIVHLDDEEIMFFQIPLENDSSENWVRVQAWLDDGNEISDRLDSSLLYVDERRNEYPRWEDQLDYIYHHGVDKWKTDVIEPVKTQFPKPE